jgi:hypothetical protein
MKEERREMFARSHDVPRSRRATGRARTFVTLSPATTFFTSAVSINGPALTRFVLSSMVARAGGGGRRAVGVVRSTTLSARANGNARGCSGFKF